MILNEDQTKQLEKAARPLIEFLNTLPHPHVTVIVGCDRAELLEGISQIITDDYIRD